VALAGKLVKARIEEGSSSGYDFAIAEENGSLAGYSCFGLIDGTESSYDLFWIVVDPKRQRGGLGRQLLERTEAAIRDAGGTRYYAETSSTETYAPTRQFYLRAGFKEVATIADFYRAGDGKVIFEKRV
jgi:ribosomal protein S18 acetylase RimI-like enzyme